MSPRKKTEQASEPERTKRPGRAAAPEPEQAAPTGASDAPAAADAAAGADAAQVAGAISSDRIVVFALSGQRYALPIDHVQEIQQIVAFTSAPDSMEALVGIVNLRGVVVPLMDLRLLLGMEPAPYTLETPMIICRAHGSIVAVVVDEVEDVLAIPAGCLQPPPRPHALASRMLGVCRLEPDLVFVLDLDRVMPAEAFGDRAVTP